MSENKNLEQNVASSRYTPVNVVYNAFGGFVFGMALGISSKVENAELWSNALMATIPALGVPLLDSLTAKADFKEAFKTRAPVVYPAALLGIYVGQAYVAYRRSL